MFVDKPIARPEMPDWSAGAQDFGADHMANLGLVVSMCTSLGESLMHDRAPCKLAFIILAPASGSGATVSC